MKMLTRTPPPPEPSAKEIDRPRTIQRSIEITVEREIISVVSEPRSSFTALCSQCQRDVVLLSAEAAAHAAVTSPREIYRWLETGRLHFQELPSGNVFICSESLKTFERPSQPSPEQLSSGESL